MSKYQKYTDALHQLADDNHLRKLPEEVPENCINLSSNDYLGINKNAKLKDEFLQTHAMSEILFGSASSRLLTGNYTINNQLEQTIAQAYNKEACLLYNSGYHVNIGILPALSDKEDLIVADKLIHASIIDGIRLSNATLMRYNHLNIDHLVSILENFRTKYKRVFIVTESIFSMDGDIADLKKLVEIKNNYNAFLYVDEAHALGVRGEHGLGITEEMNLTDEIELIVGTFGKALASVGAYLVCNEIIKQYLVNKSRSLIFTTALPPVNQHWTQFVFKKMLEMKAERKHLKDISQAFCAVNNKKYESHIVPFIIGSNADAVNAANELRKKGIYVMPIRHPAVPEGTARLRFSLSADLDINRLELIKI